MRERDRTARQKRNKQDRRRDITSGKEIERKKKKGKMTPIRE